MEKIKYVTPREEGVFLFLLFAITIAWALFLFWLFKEPAIELFATIIKALR